MPDVFTETIDLEIVSIANIQEHWGKRARRTSYHRTLGRRVAEGLHPPCDVLMVRIAPRKLDDDNIRPAFKALRDGIADALGVKDNDPRVTWNYDQEYGGKKVYQVRVTITMETGNVEA